MIVVAPLKWEKRGVHLPSRSHRRTGKIGANKSAGLPAIVDDRSSAAKPGLRCGLRGPASGQLWALRILNNRLPGCIDG
jgi:hypothetical protein